MLDMDADDFTGLVDEEFARLPAGMLEGLNNMVIVVEDRPEDDNLELFGQFDGVMATESEFGGELPNRIVIYRESHLVACADEATLRDEVHTTLVHEIAHYYGIEEDRLHELGWG